mgnify:CR=1 FL=1
MYFKKKEINEAQYYNDMSLREHPSYDKALYRKALILSRLKMYKEALEVCELTG